ncbi:MAG: RHS repeat-associated core domain-containing protein [Solirubrobacterales bacterium]
MSELPAGDQTLVVDGESVPSDRRYGSYEVNVDLENGETTVLDYTIWLSPLDPAGDQRVASPTEHETGLTTPSIPGLEVRIPEGTVIRNAAGQAVKDLNITAIPVNQAPFPLPPFVPIPVYFTVQPGSAYLSKGAQIVYPNWGDLRPGQRAEFWNYDAEDRGWYVYGRGTVSADGEQVVPDPGVRVWQFTGAMLAASPLPPGTHPTGTSGGDPVDLFSGLFTYSERDLVLPDTIPIILQRTYRQSDSNSYSFGIGTTNYYDMRLWSGAGAAEANLVMPDGERIHFVRITPGTGFSDGAYKSTSTPGPFYASTLTYNPSAGGAYWNLNLTNGMTFVFGVGRLLEIRDPHGNKIVITRSGENITQITSPHGRWVKFTYDGASRITEATDNGGRHVKYSYTSGRLTKVTDAAGRTTEFAYNGSSQMISLTNGRGKVFLENEYDAGGRVKKQTMGDGGTFEFDYELDGEGNVKSTTLTDPRGSEREVVFDARGLPTSETVGLETESEETSTFEWQPETGLLLSTTDPLGRQTDFEYDSNGNVTEVTRLAGTEDAQTDEFAYEPGTDRVTEVSDSLDHTTKHEYGSNGELLKETDPLGHETTYKYNGDGQIVSVKNPENEETELTYNNGDLVAETDPLDRKTTQFVDSLGRVRAITAPGGQRALYGYNAVNDLTSVTAPSGAETAIEYDADGNPISVTDPRGGETTAAYDVMGRLESMTDPVEHATELSYDKAGLLEEVEDRRGLITQFDYDALGRRTAARYGISGESAESTIEYGYDDANRLTDIDDSASGEYALSYDDLDRLTALDGPNGTVGYEYDAAGRREAMTATGLGTVGYEHDDADRLTEVAAGEQTVSLAYDKADRLESLALPNGIEQEFSYNEAGEPTSIAYRKGETNLGEINYAFDLNGRIEAMWGSYARLALPEALGSAKYNAANEMVEREGEELEYDAEGQLTSDGANEYSWDARGQLSAISGTDSGSFAYDPFGRRISKTLGATTTDLLHDGPNVIQESVEGSVTANLLTGPSMDQLFSRTTAEGTDSYLTSLLGSVVALSNGSGEVETAYTYDPFGAASEAGEPSDNPFQYTGRENDGNGLQYNRARYYQPLNARFISQDPIGFDGGTANLYEYGANDPLDYSDPTGLCVLGLPCPSSEDVVNTSAGIGDSLLSPPGSGFGPIPNIDPGPYLRDKFGIDNVEECSGTYEMGRTAGEVATLATGVAGLPKKIQTARRAAERLSKHLDETMVHVRKDW